MSDNNDNNKLSPLVEQLKVIDNVNTPKALSMAEDETDKLIVDFSMKILKLAKIGSFIKNNCSDKAITSAFKLYNAIAMDSIQLLLGELQGGE